MGIRSVHVAFLSSGSASFSRLVTATVTYFLTVISSFLILACLIIHHSVTLSFNLILIVLMHTTRLTSRILDLAHCSNRLVYFSLIVSAYRYIAITNLPIIPVFVEYLGQFLIDLHQIYRHSSVPKTRRCAFFQLLSSSGFRARRRRDFFCHVVRVTV